MGFLSSGRVIRTPVRQLADMSPNKMKKFKNEKAFTVLVKAFSM